MKKLIFVSLLLGVFCAFRVFNDTPVDVTEQTLKIGGTKTEEMYYGFAEGDRIVFSFTEAEGKELKEVEITEYPSSSKFSDYKTSKIENKIIHVTKTAVYKFRFYNGALGARVCKIRIQRIPATDQTKNFITDVTWITKQDTSWSSSTKDIVAGYDTTYVQKTRKELFKIDTVVLELFCKNERVHSETAVGQSQYSYINVSLPENTYSPHIFNPYQSKEVIAWSYWIGVGQKASEEYEKANSNLSEGIAAIGALTGYGALATLAVSGISMFGTPVVGDNVEYKFITIQNGIERILDSGDGISASGRNDKILQGGFTIQLYNNNFRDGIDVTVKVIAVQIVKVWRDNQYTEPRVTARHETIIVREPNIETSTVPVTGL